MLSVRKDFNKVKMSDMDLTGENTLDMNQSLSPATGCYGPKLKPYIKKVRLTVFTFLMAKTK